MIQEAFERFHANNPHVYSILDHLASQWLKRHPTVGVKMLWEVLRWELGVDTNTEDTFKLNNNYTSRYARMLVDNHPAWAGRIQLRALQTK